MCINAEVWTATCISILPQTVVESTLESVHAKCSLGKNYVYGAGMEQLLCGHWTPTSLVPPSCLSYSWTQSAAAEAWRFSNFVTLGCHLCYFGIMLYWLH